MQFANLAENSGEDTNVSTLVALLYYITVTYDENFKIVANTVDEHADYINSLKIVLLMTGILFIVIILAIEIINCCYFEKKRNKQHVIQHMPLEHTQNSPPTQLAYTPQTHQIA